MIESRRKVIFHPQVDLFHLEPITKAEDPKSFSIQDLITRLKKSPFFAAAELGPLCYENPPFQLENQVDGIPVYAWRPNSPRKNTTPKCLLLIGAETREGKDLVYYVCAQLNLDDRFCCRRDPRDDKVYVVSLARLKSVARCFLGERCISKLYMGSAISPESFLRAMKSDEPR